MRLMDIQAGWDEVEAALDAGGGELTPDMVARLDALSLAEKEKIDGYVLAVRSFEGQVLSYRAIEDELAVKRKTAEARIAWLKQRVREYMTERGATELKGEIFKFKLVNAGRAPVELLVEPALLPEVYVVRTLAPDKERLRAEITAGTLAPGLARLGEPSVSLRIY